MMDDQYSDPWNDEDDPYARPYQTAAAPSTPQLGSFGVPVNNAGEPQMGLSYWQSRHDQGLPSAPSVEDLFNLSTGQLQPGWARTARGYERVAASPGTGGGYGGVDTTGVEKLPMTTSGFGAGSPPLSSFGGMLPFPGYRHAPAFQFDPYEPSSWADAENEPGYGASREQLRKQIEAGAAHRGVLRSGMTIGDIYTNLDALAQQNFKQFDDRRFRNYATNLGLARTKQDYLVQDTDRQNNYDFNVADASFKDALARWTEQVRSLTQMARPIE